MSYNLALILTVLTVVSGVVVAINRFYWQRASRWKKASPARQTLVEYSQSFFPVLLFVLIIRSFVFEPFRIPSASMEPTLVAGDFIFVKKYAYGLRLPVTETRILDTGSPKRGDVVVFRLPADPSIHYIKRVVGLPGDVIEYAGHRLTVNGEPMRVDPPIGADDDVYEEQLFARRHKIKIGDPGGSRNGRYVVPDEHYFMMGDNRDNSTDSRFPSVGPVPEANLVGEASRIWMHLDGLSWPDWSRIGNKIE